jgi:hypothetical protein
MTPRRILPPAAAAIIALGVLSTPAAGARSPLTGGPPIAATHARARSSERPVADEAREYVSLGQAVAHAAREQRAAALRRHPTAPAGDDPDVWRVAAILEALALGAVAGAVALLHVTRGRRRLRASA